MTDTVNVSIQLTTEQYAAAEALTRTRFEAERLQSGETPGEIPIEGTVKDLMTTGVAAALDRADSIFATQVRMQEALQEIIEFFMANPLANRARCTDFDWSSEAGAYIGWREACSDEEIDGVERKEILDTLAQVQLHLMDLVETKRAVITALGRAN